MSRQFVANSQRSNWQVAPAEHEIANFDEYKIKYRQYVEEMIRPLSRKSLKQKCFITISTNVLCADITTSSPDLEPIERDIYLPLEIVLTKWSMADANKLIHERELASYVWLINPGPPTRKCNYYAMEHKKFHKIDYNLLTTDEKDDLVENDLNAVIKEINSKLLPDRTVFSLGLRNCRQDLGVLKWLVRETGYKIRPINVYSLEDLYVVLIRHLNPDTGRRIGQGFARHRMADSTNPYENKIQCDYHRLRAKEDADAECGYCAKALAECWVHVLLDDVVTYTNLFEANNTNEPVVTAATGY